MLKFKELLKPFFKKYKLTALVLVVLTAFTIVICAAATGKSVNIYDGENVVNLKTKKSFVYEMLQEAGVVIGENDAVDPLPDTRIKGDAEIFIRRAVAVRLHENDFVKEFFVPVENVGDALALSGAVLGEHDIVTPAADEVIQGNVDIYIKRAAEVILAADGEEKTIYTVGDTVAEVMEQSGIVLGDADRLDTGMETPVEDKMRVNVIRVTSEVLEVTEDIPYKSETRTTSQLEKGKSRTVQAGKNGKKTVKYEVVYENGDQVSKKEISSTVVTKPQNAIVEHGTVTVATTSRGENFRYSRVIQCTATAYDLSYESCGKRPGDPGYGITASGMKAAYGVVAVDRSVIPLGTRLYIEAHDGKSWTYGYAVAGDTGSGIRGNRVDLFFNTRSEALAFGRKTANVYILD